jgi:hypothetical protein
MQKVKPINIIGVTILSVQFFIYLGSACLALNYVGLRFWKSSFLWVGIRRRTITLLQQQHRCCYWCHSLFGRPTRLTFPTHPSWGGSQPLQKRKLAGPGVLVFPPFRTPLRKHIKQLNPFYASRGRLDIAGTTVVGWQRAERRCRGTTKNRHYSPLDFAIFW